MSIPPKTGKRRRENENALAPPAPMPIPISLRKPSLRRRLEDYYSLIAPGVISNEKEWRQEFEVIHDKYGGTTEKELTLATNLAKKYGNVVRLKLTNESTLTHLLNQAEKTAVPPSENKKIAIKAHKDMANMEANATIKAGETTKSVSAVIKPGASLSAYTNSNEATASTNRVTSKQDLSVLASASASVSAALPSKNSEKRRRIKMGKKKAKKKEQEAKKKAKKKEQEAALYLNTHPSVPLASFSSLSPTSQKVHAEKMKLENAALCDALKRYDGHLFLKEYMLLIDSPNDQNKRDVDIYSFSKVTKTIRHADGRKKRMDTITNGVWQCVISLRAAFGYHQRNVQAKDLPIDDDNSFIISVEVPELQNPENNKLVRWFCFYNIFAIYWQLKRF